MRSWIIGALFFFVNGVAAQQLVQGKVIDSETGEPVPFASIGVMGTSKGTSSNSNGEFSILITDQATLEVTSLGYQSTRVRTIKEDMVVELRSIARELPTLVITTKKINPRKVVRKAFANKKNNYKQGPFSQEFFYRHYCMDNGVYGRLIEAYVDLYKPFGYQKVQTKAGEKESLRIKQLRRSMDNTDFSISHEPISVVSILNSDVIGYQQSSGTEHQSIFNNVSNLRNDLDDYSFENRGISYYNDLQVYEIAYNYKKDSVLLSSGGYLPLTRIEGIMYVTTEDYAIVKMEEVKNFENSTVTTTTYYRQYNDVYYPYHFIKEGLNIGTDNSSHSYHIELMSANINEGADNAFDGQIPDDEGLMDIPYDSMFWANNTNLKTTRLENEIIRDLGRGTSLNQQFYLYRKFQRNTHNGGEDGESKLKWFLDYSKGKKPNYIIIWNTDNYNQYLIELEWAKRLFSQMRGKLNVIFVSTDDDNMKWDNTVRQYNLNANGILNYRIGKDSELLNDIQQKKNAVFVLISKDGTVHTKNVRPPSDPELIRDIEQLTQL